MSQKIDFGLAKETGAFVCQRCGLYFSRKGKEMVCPACKKLESSYINTGNTQKEGFSIVGIIIGVIIVLAFLIGIGGL